MSWQPQVDSLELGFGKNAFNDAACLAGLDPRVVIVHPLGASSSRSPSTGVHPTESCISDIRDGRDCFLGRGFHLQTVG